MTQQQYVAVMREVPETQQKLFGIQKPNRVVLIPGMDVLKTKTPKMLLADETYPFVLPDKVVQDNDIRHGDRLSLDVRFKSDGSIDQATLLAIGDIPVEELPKERAYVTGSTIRAFNAKKGEYEDVVVPSNGAYSPAYLPLELWGNRDMRMLQIAAPFCFGATVFLSAVGGCGKSYLCWETWASLLRLSGQIKNLFPMAVVLGERDGDLFMYQGLLELSKKKRGARGMAFGAVRTDPFHGWVGSYRMALATAQSEMLTGKHVVLIVDSLSRAATAFSLSPQIDEGKADSGMASGGLHNVAIGDTARRVVSGWYGPNMSLTIIGTVLSAEDKGSPEAAFVKVMGENRTEILIPMRKTAAVYPKMDLEKEVITVRMPHLYMPNPAMDERDSVRQRMYGSNADAPNSASKAGEVLKTHVERNLKPTCFPDPEAVTDMSMLIKPTDLSKAEDQLAGIEV